MMSDNPSANPSTTDHIRWFREASPYINVHRGKTFVLMLGGEAVDSPNLPNIVGDIALLNSLGVRIVIAFGCRPQLNSALSAAGIEAGLSNGRRITTPEALAKLEYSMADNRLTIESLFSTGDCNVKLCGGNFITARPAGVIDGVDLQLTGTVRKIDHQTISKLLDSGFVVTLGPIGFSVTGERFNLTAEEIATETAIALGADKLIFFGSSDGVYREEALIRELACEEGKQLESPAPFVTQSIRACESGVKRSHIISHHANGALLQELFTRDGHGTMIAQQGFETLRQATIDDVPGILALVRPLEEQGILVTRSRELLEQQHQQFTVIERDGVVIGCAALHHYPETRTGELACITTHPDYQKGSRGLRLLQAIEQQARNSQLESLFVLTTQTEHWFVEKGYVESTTDALPAGKKEVLSADRGSKILVKTL